MRCPPEEWRRGLQSPAIVSVRELPLSPPHGGCHEQKQSKHTQLASQASFPTNTTTTPPSTPANEASPLAQRTQLSISEYQLTRDGTPPSLHRFRAP